MTDAIDRARSIVAGMTPGPWDAWLAVSPKDGSRHVIRARWTEGNARLTAFPATCDMAGIEYNKANAAGIVFSTELARLLYGDQEGAREAIARVIEEGIWILREDFTDETGRTVKVNIIKGVEETADAIIDRLAEMALGEKEGGR